MILIQGKGVSKGAACGPLYFFRRAAADIPRTGAGPTAELERFARAQAEAVAGLEALANQCRSRSDGESAALFEAHAMLVEDEDFVAAIRGAVSQGASAEFAVQSIGEQFAGMFSAMDDPYMRARAADMQDIARHLALPLLGIRRTFPGASEAIVVCDHFLPSEVMHMDERLLGLVSQKGSLDSHTAVLLKAYHIPVIVGTEFGPEWDGHRALIDGFAGNLYLDPDNGTEAALRLRYQPKH